MPKVDKGKGTATQNALLIYIYAGKRVMGTRRDSHLASSATCRGLFPTIPKTHCITFHTRDPEMCDGELTEISPETWGDVIPSLKKVLVMSEDAKEDELPVSSLARGTHDPFVVEFSYESHKMSVGVTYNTRVSTVLNFVASRFGVCVDNMKFYYGYAGRRLSKDRDDLVKDWKLSPDAYEIICFREQCGGKPVIYLFAPSPLEASVSLSFSPHWELSAIYPIVPSTKTPPQRQRQVTWRVQTHRNGDLTDLSTGRDVSYLFWEAHTLPKNIDSPPPPIPIQGVSGDGNVEVFIPNDASVTNENAVVLSVDEITPYLDTSLQVMGLHTEAPTSFIIYWLPSFLKHRRIALRFLPQASYEAFDISPLPDVVARVFMLFKGVDEAALSDWQIAVKKCSEDASFWADVVGVDVSCTLDAKLFRALEWGGMEVLFEYMKACNLGIPI